VISANANLTATDTYAGGEGTDTVAFTAQIADAAGTFSEFCGFEFFEVSPGATDAFTMSNFINNTNDFTRIDFADGGNSAVGTTNVSASVTGIRLITGSTGGEVITFDRLVDTTTSSLDVSARLAGTVTELIANDEESVTISGSTAAMDIVFTDLTLQDATSLTITGAADVTTSGNIDATILATVDASAATGAIDLDAGDSAVAITATGGTGGFTFEGGSGSDTITGSSGTDVLVGNGGTDTISGGHGTDSLTGGNGADNLTGGAGVDSFLFAADTVAAQGGDTITDFTGLAGGDVIVVDSDAAAAVVFSEVAGDVGGAGSAVDGEVFILTGNTSIDVSGTAAADLTAISAVFFVGTNEGAINADILCIFKADTNGDGSVNAIQAYHLEETTGANSSFDEASLVATLSNISTSADLASDFVAANFDFT
jgi:Ca2+-binding RTX toxin-like protein